MAAIYGVFLWCYDLECPNLLLTTNPPRFYLHSRCKSGNCISSERLGDLFKAAKASRNLNLPLPELRFLTYLPCFDLEGLVLDLPLA